MRGRHQEGQVATLVPGPGVGLSQEVLGSGGGEMAENQPCSGGCVWGTGLTRPLRCYVGDKVTRRPFPWPPDPVGLGMRPKPPLLCC